MENGPLWKGKSVIFEICLHFFIKQIWQVVGHCPVVGLCCIRDPGKKVNKRVFSKENRDGGGGRGHNHNSGKKCGLRTLKLKQESMTMSKKKSFSFLHARVSLFTFLASQFLRSALNQKRSYQDKSISFLIKSFWRKPTQPFVLEISDIVYQM